MLTALREHPSICAMRCRFCIVPTLLRWLFLTSLLLSLLPACRKAAVSAADSGVQVSPRANPAVATVGARATPAPAGRVGRVDDDDAAAGVLPDRGSATEQQPPAGTSPAADAAIDEEAIAAEARRRTEQAVDRSLRAAFGTLQRCYQVTHVPGRRTVLRFRLHRSGYIVNPEVSTGNEQLDACLEGVLDKLRVATVETDSMTIERTIEFTAK